MVDRHLLIRIIWKITYTEKLTSGEIQHLTVIGSLSLCLSRESSCSRATFYDQRFICFECISRSLSAFEQKKKVLCCSPYELGERLTQLRSLSWLKGPHLLLSSLQKSCRMRMCATVRLNSQVFSREF